MCEVKLVCDMLIVLLYCIVLYCYLAPNMLHSKRTKVCRYALS